MFELTKEQMLTVRYAKSISNAILNIIREPEKREEVDYFDFEKLDEHIFADAMDLAVKSIKNRIHEE